MGVLELTEESVTFRSRRRHDQAATRGRPKEGLGEHWAKNVQSKHFSGNEYYEPRAPRDATLISLFPRAIGEVGVEELFKGFRSEALRARFAVPTALSSSIGRSARAIGRMSHDSRWLPGATAAAA